MKAIFRVMAVTAGLLVSQVSIAQVPAGAPAGAMGICKDGTYSTSGSKSGACKGHKGVQTWYSAASSAPQTTKSTATSTMAPKATPAAAAPMPMPMPMPAPAKAPASATKAAAAPMAQAAGGGPGMVWVNTSTKVYHCAGTKYYGKTKEGKYMSEADAKGMGAHADHGTACSK